MAEFNVTVYTQPFGVAGTPGPAGSNADGTISINGKTGALQGVCTWNGLTGSIILSAGSNITLGTIGNTVTVSSIGGVSSYNGNTGNVQGVCTWNGLTGNVTGVTTGVANIFGPLQTFTNGISSSGAFIPEFGLTGSFLTGSLVLNNLFNAAGQPDNYNPTFNSVLSVNTATAAGGRILLGNTWYIKSTDDCINVGGSNLNTVLLTSGLPTTGSVVVGNRNLQKLIQTNNITVFGMDNLNAISAPDANITLVGKNICMGVSSADNLTAFGTNIGNVGTNRIDNSAIFGYRALAGSGVTAINNVIIGSEALSNNSGEGSTCASTSNNIIIGYQPLKFLNAFNNNTQLGLNNSVIIASAYEPSNSELDNVAIAENQALGHTQLLIGSGKTAWITGSCAGYVGIGGVTTPLGELHVRNRIVLNPASAPATSTSAGVTGSIAWDNDFLYVCAVGNSWRRAPLSGYV